MGTIKKVGIPFVFGFFFLLIFLWVRPEQAFASSQPKPDFNFFIGGSKIEGSSPYKMTTATVPIQVTAQGWAPADYEVELVSSSERVVDFVFPNGPSNPGTMRRQGPGHSTIVATITTKDNYKLTISCNIEVGLEVAWGSGSNQTKFVWASTVDEKVVQLTVGESQTIYMRYLKDPQGVTGGSIDAGGVEFKSSDEMVVEVDPETGKLIGKGGGSAVITVSSKTLSGKDKPMMVSVNVVVVPTFKISWHNGSESVTADSVDKEGKGEPVRDVPSGFVVESNAHNAKNLKWEVYDCTGTGKDKPKLLPQTGPKLEYIVSDVSGNVTFSNVKAGTYEIWAFAGKDYKKGHNVTYAYMKIIVPIQIKDEIVVMQVNDTYDIFGNSNLPAANAFKYTSDNMNVVTVTEAGVIKAVTAGTAKIKCTLNEALFLFTDPSIKKEFTITVTVIDGMSLNMTSARIYEGGTLLLTADATDNTIATWSSNNVKVATVEGGLVTGKSAGEAIITASVKINGVVKTAECKVRVLKTVTQIVINPSEINLALEEGATLIAIPTPGDISIKLKWKSSNPKIVDVIVPSDTTAVIKAGKVGGHAVISAINQDNVVVGYCHVTVRQPVTEIKLSETKIIADLNGRTIQLRAIVYPENAVNKDVKWKSSDPDKATVDENNGLVTVKKPGTVSIIATSVDNPKVTAICNIDILIPVNSISLDSTEKIMYVGETARLSYTMSPADASTNGVIWTSTNPKVATVNGTGLVTAKSPGTAVIILKSEDGGYTSYCNIIVKREASGIKLDASALNLKAGEVYALKATLTPADSTDAKITWESSDTKVATVDANGKVTAKATGSTIIMAKLATGATVYCRVNVTTPVSGLVINFTEKTIYKGEKFKLKVSVTPSNATLLDVIWTSSNTKIATVDESGEVTAITGGTVIITCKTKEGGYTANCVLTVLEGVTNISLNHQTYYLGVDKSVMLVATVSSPSATNQEIKWSTSNSSIATVSQKGKVTGKKLASVTITATAMDGSEAEATCDIQVVKPVESISLNNTSISLLVGQTKKLKATVKPANATLKSAKWTSSDPSVAIVDEDGEVIAIKAGSTTITAEALDNSGKKAICYVNVYERVSSTGITMQDKQVVMIPGEEKIVRSVLTPANSTDGLTWSTDNEAVARVDKNTGKITARSKGVAYITAMTDSGKTAQVEVLVIGLNMTELTLEQYTTYPYPLQVEGTNSAVSWSIDNPSVAVVTNGRVSTRGVGKATITATVNGRRLTCKLKVVKIK